MRTFASRILQPTTIARDKLVLYHFDGCPYCARVRAAVARLGLDVELRSIREAAEHREALVAAMGRDTVPVLRITGPDGSERWIPESRDIIRYLVEERG